MNHRIFFLALLPLLGMLPRARAEVSYTEADNHDPTVIRMTVTAAAEPVPALKYRLVGRDIDLKTGNAAPYYYRALINLPQTMERVRKEFGDDFDNWCVSGADGTPIEKLPLDKVRKAVEMTSEPIRYGLADAVSRRTCDWELDIEDLRGPEVISFLMPEFQHSRDLGRALAIRTRLAIAERRYDDAIESMRMTYRLGHDVATLPLLVSGLIGLAIDGVGNTNMVDLIASRNSPNLYWALGDLTSVIVDLQPAAHFELDFGPRIFPIMIHPETKEHAPQEWNRLFTKAVQDLHEVVPAGMPHDATTAGVMATGLALINYSHAKDRLVAQGMDSDKVERMAVGQVLAIYTERIYQQETDSYEKLWSVPFQEMEQRGAELDQRLQSAHPLSGSEDREVLPIVRTLMPAMYNARAAQVRAEREVAALRVIEALRMYASAHDGKLPAKLDDIENVSVPVNPATGKPFVYRLEGATAILELPASDRIPHGNRRYEIQIASKN